MPKAPEAIAADIEEAATPGFRGRLIARGQARAIIWRDGVLPPDAPAFAPQLNYNLYSYGYTLLGLGLRLRELAVCRTFPPNAIITVTEKGQQRMDLGLPGVEPEAHGHIASAVGKRDRSITDSVP
jgi:hypothetical protein